MPMSGLLISRFNPLQPATDRKGLAEWSELLRLVLRTWQTRRALLEMTPRELSDIGISRATAIEEASRLPWDIAPTGDRA
jgi:uncharacterized protein YjiS (DUF1127 family)